MSITNKRKYEYDSDSEYIRNKKPRILDPFSISMIDCKHLAMSIVGKSSSGKTQIVKKILESDYCRYTFNRCDIFYIIDSIDKTISLNFPDITHIKAGSLTHDEIGDGLSSLLSDDNSEKLIIFDDMTHIFPSGKKTTILYEALTKMVNGGIHSKLNYILISQKYTSIPVYLRANIHYCILFRPNTQLECAAMLRETKKPGKDNLDIIINSLKEFECCFIDKKSYVQKRYLWNNSSFIPL